MIAPNLEKGENLNKILLKSISYSLLIIMVAIVFTQATLGVEQAKHANFPFLIFVRLIDNQSILQRIESVVILMWMVAIILKISIYLYISSKSLKEVLNVKGNKKCVYIFGVLIGAITYYISEYNPQIEKIVSIKLPEYTSYLIFKALIPLIALIVYFFRRKTIMGEEANH